MSKTLLVSAFFDIGRGTSDISYQVRNVDTYFEYFKFWARIKNDIVVYTQPEFVERILSIRKSFGLLEQTKVIAIEDITSIEPDVFSAMKAVEQKGEFKILRYIKSDISNEAKYDYVMLLKYWCMQDAVKQSNFDGNVVWMDFGFNHGNDCYSNAEDFVFMWEPEITHKIQLYVKSNPDEQNGISSLLYQTDCIMGSPVISPSDYCEKLWNYCKNSMEALLSLDAFDDDQQLLLMAYRTHPNDFEINYSNWFLPIKENGGSHLRIKADYDMPKPKSLYQSIRQCCANIWFWLSKNYKLPTPYNYSKRIFNYLKKIKR